MRRLFYLSLLCLLSLSAKAQILDPVDWDVTVQALDDDTYVLQLKADIDDGWYVYSQYLESDDGPVRTSLYLDNEETSYDRVGNADESGELKEGYDAMFDMNVKKFGHEMIITQKLKVKDQAVNSIKGYVEYMTCDDTRCLPPTEEAFEVGLPQAKKKDEPQQGTPEVEEKPRTEQSSDAGVGLIEGLEIEGDVDLEFDEEPSDIKQPVKWNHSFSDGSLVIEASIAKGWKIYSNKQPSKDYSIQPTSAMVDGAEIAVQENSNYRKVYFDQIFEEELAIIENEVQYTIDGEVIEGAGSVELVYMVCDDEQCLFPEPYIITTGTSTVDKTNSSSMLADVSALYGIPKPVKDDLDDSCLITSEVKEVNKKGLWEIFGLGFLGGLLALLTPCVFPMIPLTVSFFTKKNEKDKGGISKALGYGFSILAIYLVLSIPFHFLETINPDILNNISTNVFLNLTFFVAFLIFAFSFFGFYELTLPSSWTNKVSSAEGAGGILGIFFMALTLCLVSFSCTGPILGSLLAGALTNEGGAYQLTAGMGGFGLALALPFGVFAAIPKLMNKLPRSGNWMNTMKVVLGFAELALAFKFLSNADLVKQWGLLKYEPFMIIWILCALGLAAYMFKLIRFPHDSPGRKLGPGRIALGGIALALAIYMSTGFMYNKKFDSYQSLELLSGLAPPTGYSYRHPSHCPAGLTCFNELSAGMSYAQEVDKPVLLDFTGFACVNCRKMEEHVWPTEGVLDRLEKDYVLISLYVDDKKELNEEIVVPRVTGDGERTLRTKGEVWQHFQTEYFNNNSQPFYVLLGPDGTVLNQPVGYTPDAKKYAEFLECGLDEMQNRKNLEGFSMN